MASTIGIVLVVIVLWCLIAGVTTAQANESQRREIELLDHKERKRLEEFGRRDELRRLEAEARDAQRRLERADERALELGVRAMESQHQTLQSQCEALQRQLDAAHAAVNKLKPKIAELDARQMEGAVINEDDVVQALPDEHFDVASLPE